MSRIFKKFYIFAIFLFGVLFYTVFKNVTFPESTTGKDFSTRVANHREVLIKHVSNLEGEIAAQKHYSSILLGKIRTKYSLSADKKKKSSESSGKNEIGNEKLEALQKELQQEAHPGEDRSDLNVEADYHKKDGKGHLHNRDKDKEEDFANGEVIDEHLPPGRTLLTGGDNNIANNKIPEKESSSSSSVIAVLVFVCDRPTIKRSLDTLLKYRTSDSEFPIIVSQDCGSHAATTAVIESYGDRITHIMQPDLSDIVVPPKEKKLKGYYKIARHYGWALNQTFNVLNYQQVIIVEDDLEVAPDFFEYFAATLPILKKDSSLWCVSAWNDNGKPTRINTTAYDLLHRTDFFPGLGWMMTKSLWNELMVKWPKGYWDDWMREPAQRRDRICIRPEISRTSTFGKEGVSHGTYYMNHLRYIKLNDHFVPFKSLDLSYLVKDQYDVEFVRRVYSSHLVSSVSELLSVTSETPTPSSPIEYRLIYRTKLDFRNYAKKLELMEDFKAGVPRTAYRGVVPFVMNGYRCYLAPGANWESYQPY